LILVIPLEIGFLEVWWY